MLVGSQSRNKRRLRGRPEAEYNYRFLLSRFACLSGSIGQDRQCPMAIIYVTMEETRLYACQDSSLHSWPTRAEVVLCGFCHLVWQDIHVLGRLSPAEKLTSDCGDRFEGLDSETLRGRETHNPCLVSNIYI